MEEESDVIEMMTTGRFYRKNKLYYISYEETEATGYEGCRSHAEGGSKRQGDHDPLWTVALAADCSVGGAPASSASTTPGMAP